MKKHKLIWGLEQTGVRVLDWLQKVASNAKAIVGAVQAFGGETHGGTVGASCARGLGIA